MAAALVNGVLAKEPERRMGGNGRPVVVAEIRENAGGASGSFEVVAHDEQAQAQLLAMHEGDAVSVLGEVRLSLAVSQVMSLRATGSQLAIVAPQSASQKPKRPRPQAVEWDDHPDF